MKSKLITRKLVVLSILVFVLVSFSAFLLNKTIVAPAVKNSNDKFNIVGQEETLGIKTTLDGYKYYIDDAKAEVIIVDYIGNKTEIEIPNEIENISVKKIDITCFVHNKTIETVVVPKSVYQINSWAFAGCKSLKKIIINNPDTLFGDCVFIDTNAMICAQKNSKVERYATDNNIKFEELN